MTPLLLQGLLSLLALAFGLVSLRVSARLRRGGAGASGWALTGMAYTLAGALALAEALLGALAHGPAGAASATFAERAAGPLDEAAGMVLAGFACALWLLVARRGFVRWSAVRTWGLLLVCAGAGAAAGAGQSAFQERLHYSMLAVTSAATVLALLGALWTALRRDALDYLLWLALGLYALREAVDVNLVFVLRWMGAVGGGLPSAALGWAAAGTWGAMLVLAVMRLRAAQRGVHVPGLLAAAGARRWRARGASAGR